ncbi:MAG TPA: hypothetical protein VF596_17765 [Pyrinomonadaceae bacterium]|jgi:hypothetical protein
MSGNKWFDRSIGILALIVSCIAAYYAYLSYQHDLESDTKPELDFHFRIIEGEIDKYDDVIKVDKTQLKRVNGFIEFELPVSVVNSSKVDANKVTMWLGVQDGDSLKIDIIPGCNWRNAKKPNGKGKWIIGNFEHLSPGIENRYECHKFKVMENVEEFTLKWDIFASRFPVKSGQLKVLLL